MMKTVTIIGAGNVGTTLAILLTQRNYVIQEICSRTKSSAERLREIIGSGQVVSECNGLKPADICLVSTGDNEIPLIAEQLLSSPVLRPGKIFFHCSGAAPSSIFVKLHERGALITSVHPVKTFTSPPEDAGPFAGTWCGVEGDIAALDVVEPLFQELGGLTFRVDAERKALYHAAVVFISNYLCAISEIGLQCYEAAGVTRETASRIVEPILHATVDNALRLGPGKALTGPIARGDHLVAAKHLEALGAFSAEYQLLYKELGAIAVQLSLQKGIATQDKRATIRSLLG